MAEDPIQMREAAENDAAAADVMALRAPDGTIAELVLANVDGRQTSEIKRTIGRSFRSVLGGIAAKNADEDIDLDDIAVLWWLARVQSGERVSLDDVLGEITYSSFPSIAPRSEVVDDDDPLRAVSVRDIGA